MKSAWVPELWCYLGKEWPRLLEMYWSDYSWDFQSKIIPSWVGGGNFHDDSGNLSFWKLSHLGRSGFWDWKLSRTWVSFRQDEERTLFSHWILWHFFWVLLHAHVSGGGEPIFPTWMQLKTSMVVLWRFLVLASGPWDLRGTTSYSSCKLLPMLVIQILVCICISWGHIWDPLLEILIKYKMGPLILFVTDTPDNSNAFSLQFNR